MRDELLAVFADPEAAADALRALRDDGVTRVRVVSPAPYPVVEQTGHPGPWRALGWIALAAGLTGLCGAMALEVITSRSMDLIVGGKPIVSWTAFGVVMFEMTMLGAGIATFTAVVVLSAITRRRVAQAARDAIASDRIAVVIAVADPDRRAAIARHLTRAVEVRP
jgi:hypothetical protein